MDNLLPLFPLQLVVFPAEHLNLHIFEPRYRQLVKECEEEGITFGIPAYIGGKVMEVATEVRLMSVEKRYPNGELDIKTEGAGLFRIREFYRTAPGKLYSAAEVEPLHFDMEGDATAGARIRELVSELFELLHLHQKPGISLEGLSTYSIGHHVGLNLEQEYEMLCIPGERERQAWMEAHLQKLLPVAREMEKLRKKVQMNGHFKNIVPPKL
ncbi:MAG: LON peptidase substrate-binding domain-containing protein [Phaeodactylibacter sp.]|nr:LON peptidase substrate-binding domain-containing protein [Phaeodactylibacter sp.]MCB9274335.1 LON peptidase substrate-binding domain-containing protein [Lewinellaceae bacterium]